MIDDSIKVSAPAGKFVFTGTEASAVLLIAGGVGITPMMSIVRYLTDRVWSGDIYFLVIAKTEREIIFHDELRWLENRFPKLHLYVTLTREELGSLWQGERGRANGALLKRFVPNLVQVSAYLCGPDEMMNSTHDLLVELGVPNNQIKTEAFVSPAGNTGQQDSNSGFTHGIGASTEEIGLKAVAKEGRVTQLYCAKSGLGISIDDDKTILEAAEEAGVEIPYECRSGICGQCKTKALRGTIVMDSEDAISSSEKAEGYILACQARLRSDAVIDV